MNKAPFLAVVALLTTPALAAAPKGGWACKVTMGGFQLSRPMTLSKTPPDPKEMQFQDKAAVVTGAPLFIYKAGVSPAGALNRETIYINQADFKYLIGGTKLDPGGYKLRTYDGDHVNDNDAFAMIAPADAKQDAYLASSASFGDNTAFTKMAAALKAGTPATLPFTVGGKGQWFTMIFLDLSTAGFAAVHKKALARAKTEKAIEYVPC